MHMHDAFMAHLEKKILLCSALTWNGTPNNHDNYPLSSYDKQILSSVTKSTMHVLTKSCWRLVTFSSRTLILANMPLSEPVARLLAAEAKILIIQNIMIVRILHDTILVEVTIHVLLSCYTLLLFYFCVSLSLLTSTTTTCLIYKVKLTLINVTSSMGMEVVNLRVLCAKSVVEYCVFLLRDTVS